MRFSPASLWMMVLLPTVVAAADLAGTYRNEQDGSTLTIEVSRDGVVKAVIGDERDSVLTGRENPRGRFTARFIGDKELGIEMSIAGTLNGDVIEGTYAVTIGGETTRTPTVWRRSDSKGGAIGGGKRPDATGAGRPTTEAPLAGGQKPNGEIVISRRPNAPDVPLAFTPPDGYLLYWPEQTRGASGLVMLSRTGALDQDYLRVSLARIPQTMRGASAGDFLDVWLGLAKGSGKATVAQRVKNTFWDGAVVHSRAPSPAGKRMVENRVWMMVVGEHYVSFESNSFESDELDAEGQKLKDQALAADLKQLLLSVRRTD